jgi:hypothetical protein
MRRIFILSKRFEDSADWTQATFEMLDIRAAATTCGIDVVPVGPQGVEVVARQAQAPHVYLSGIESSPADGLIVRGMSGPHYEIAGIATRAMSSQGSFCLDPADRFANGSGSKASTTIERSCSGVGSDSIVLSRRSERIDEKHLAILMKRCGLSFPLIAKPADGRQGDGVEAVHTLDELSTVLSNLRSDDYIIQPLENFVREYRVMTLRGECLGVALKTRVGGSVTANASAGASFAGVSDDERLRVSQIALEMAPHTGLAGLDIGVTTEDRWILIEANSAPQWNSFAVATGVNVAAAVIDLFSSFRSSSDGESRRTRQ